MAKARMAELQLAEAEGRMVDGLEMQQAVSGLVVRLRNRILAVAKRLQMRLPHLTREDIAVIDEELREALLELSRHGDTEERDDGV
jgi:phage terminase Nu1 subunit (DNA packaging protein)